VTTRVAHAPRVQGLTGRIEHRAIHLSFIATDLIVNRLHLVRKTIYLCKPKHAAVSLQRMHDAKHTLDYTRIGGPIL